MIHLSRRKKHHFISIFAFNVYFFLYYWSIGYLSTTTNTSGLSWLERWPDLLMKLKAPFLFEPIGRLRLFGIELLVAPLNILIGAALGLLVYLNVLAVLYMKDLPKQCRIDSKWNGLVGILPSFLTGFACCAPSFIIPLTAVFGSSVSMLSSYLGWLLPLSFVLLLYGTFSSYRKIRSIQNQSP